jgi:hypothetical protein
LLPSEGLSGRSNAPTPAGPRVPAGSAAPLHSPPESHLVSFFHCVCSHDAHLGFSDCLTCPRALSLRKRFHLYACADPEPSQPVPNPHPGAQLGLRFPASLSAIGLPSGCDEPLLEGVLSPRRCLHITAELDSLATAWTVRGACASVPGVYGVPLVWAHDKGLRDQYLQAPCSGPRPRATY